MAHKQKSSILTSAGRLAQELRSPCLLHSIVPGGLLVTSYTTLFTTPHLVNDARRGLAQEFHIELVEVRDHAVSGGDGAPTMMSS
jgi:hypothetical protein